MRVVPVSEIVKDVKIILDENIQDDSVLLDETNQLQLDMIIRSRLVDAVRSIHEAAPNQLIDDGLDISSPPIPQQDGSGYIELPSDFMRLVVFQLESWRRTVTEAISDTDPKYFMQKSRFQGIRGNPEKPVCAITSGNVLEYYSIEPDKQAVILKAKYLPLPSIENDKIKVCKKLYTSIIWECAGMVAVSVKDQSANSFFEISKRFIQ